MLERINGLPMAAARTEFLSCCGSTRWAEEMARSRPFPDENALYRASERIWASLDHADWLEAFEAHPRIGDLKTAGTREAGEQAGIRVAEKKTLDALARGNRDYESKFGRIYLVCATGKSADEMLAHLRKRMNNDPETELSITAGEQAKITRLRLEKLVRA